METLWAAPLAATGSQGTRTVLEVDDPWPHPPVWEWVDPRFRREMGEGSCLSPSCSPSSNR